MLNYPNNTFIQSLPISIRWAGFESDTLKLQRNGWSLAVEDVFNHVLDRHAMRFILKHKMLELYCITDVEEFQFFDLQQRMDGSIPLHFNIHVVARDIVYTQIPAFNIASIYEIDATPDFIEMDRHSIKNLSVFKTLIQPDNALIVEPDQISSLLEKIVACQSPKQAEIRERLRRSEARENMNMKQTLHAQILTVAA